jgi:hypothetical protein
MKLITLLHRLKGLIQINGITAGSIRQVVSIAAVLFIAGCSAMPVPKGSVSDPAALALLDATQRAHGKEAFAQIRDLNVSYTGTWFGLVTRLQPTLTDKAFRKTSEERTLFEESIVAQIHNGEGGKKTVLREGANAAAGANTNATATAKVWYNQQTETNKDKIDSSQLVVEAYQIFLYPAFYVRRAALLELAGTGTVNGRECDLLLAVLRPGVGNSLEDRAVLYIDREDKLVRRVRLTLEGFTGTQGAVVDVDHDKFVEIAGVKWPTHFYEALVKPFPGLPAHDFSLTGLDINRGLTKADFTNGEFSARAAKPATPLPSGIR